MNEMISFGAGVNSVAMTIMLVEDGWRGPIVFADPGAEHPDTECYMGAFERDWLKPRGLHITRISPNTYPELYAPSYRMSLPEKCDANHIVPLILSRWCTAEYKRRPLQKWARRGGYTTQLLGIAADEAHRALRSQQGSLTVGYPLIHAGIGREDCTEIIRAAGQPVPPKSGCWFCPFQRLSQWRALYDLRPDLFQRAVDMDNAAIEKMRDTRTLPFAGQLTFKFNTTLQNIKDQWDAQMELPLMPERSYEYQMCECRL